MFLARRDGPKSQSNGEDRCAIESEFAANLVVVLTLDEATTYVLNTLAEPERARSKKA